MELPELTLPRPLITVFGSSRPEPADQEYVQAYALGAALGQEGFSVCNGGYGGTMEASARGTVENGGHTVGVISRVFAGRAANRWIEQPIEVDSFIARLLTLIELGDAYVVLKGGTGTLLELSAIWELMNKGMMKTRPILALGTFWTSVVKTLQDELTREGRPDCTQYVTLVSTPEECVAALRERGLRRIP
jgi:uncharacterized protein (TIGR00730 family)